MEFREDTAQAQNRANTLEKENHRLRNIIEQLPIAKPQNAAAQLLTFGRHPENNRPVTSKPPRAQRITNMGAMESTKDIKNVNLRNKVEKMQWIYVQDLSRLTFGEICRLLRTFVFHTANIANIRNVAANIHEFVLYSLEAMEALVEIFKANIPNTTLLPEDYKFWEPINSSMPKETAQQIALNNLAKSAS
jgi:hypothetical protein